MDSNNHISIGLVRRSELCSFQCPSCVVNIIEIHLKLAQRQSYVISRHLCISADIEFENRILFGTGILRFVDQQVHSEHSTSTHGLIKGIKSTRSIPSRSLDI